MEDNENKLEDQNPLKAEGQAPTKIGKTWFIKRGDGFIFACQEQEAWGLFHNRTEWMRHDFKIIGVSDGKTYVRIIKESANNKVNLERQVAELSREVTRYLKTYDKMKYEDLLADSNPKVKKLKKILDEKNAELDKVNSELNDIQRKVIQKAFDAELEVARGHIEHPSNQDVFTPAGNKDKILKTLSL